MDEEYYTEFIKRGFSHEWAARRAVNHGGWLRHEPPTFWCILSIAHNDEFPEVCKICIQKNDTKNRFCHKCAKYGFYFDYFIGVGMDYHDIFRFFEFDVPNKIKHRLFSHTPEYWFQSYLVHTRKAVCLSCSKVHNYHRERLDLCSDCKELKSYVKYFLDSGVEYKEIGQFLHESHEFDKCANVKARTPEYWVKYVFTK